MKSLFVILFIPFMLSTLFAQVPEQIGYQAVLFNTDGTPVTDGNYNLTFRIYADSTDGSVLWEENHANAEVENGVVNIQLGSQNPIDLPFDKAYYLSIQIGADDPLLPRIPLLASPYSMTAKSVQDSSLTNADFSTGQIVRSINNLTDDVILSGGSNVSIGSDGQKIIISASNGNGDGSSNSLDAADGDPKDVVYVDTEGRVGIGTTEPKEKLDVNGNIELPATTDSSGIVLVNGKRFIHSFGNSNLFIGPEAGNFNISPVIFEGDNNIGIGSLALNSLVDGGYNMAMGPSALSKNTTGNENVAIGLALPNNTEGSSNVAIGMFSMQNNTTGNNNVAIGPSSLTFNETGSKNVAVGSGAFVNNRTGNENVAIGPSTMGNAQTGDWNIAIGAGPLLGNAGTNNIALGRASLQSNETGNQNIALGNFAMRFNESGSNNISIGAFSGMNISDLNNTVAIGTNAIVDASNKIRLGDDNISVVEAHAIFHSLDGGFMFPDGTVQTSASGDGHSLDAADGNPTDALFVDNEGRVGINTTEPNARLHVVNTGTGHGMRLYSDLTGIIVDHAGVDGLFITEAGRHGVQVIQAGNPSSFNNNTESNAFMVQGAEGFGLFVGHANLDGVHVQSAGNDGVDAKSNSSANFGGRFVNTASGGSGIYALGGSGSDNDLILGANDGSSAGDDGRIASDPDQASSDLFITSNDAVIIELDKDADGEDADFEVRNSDGKALFDVDDSGDATLLGTLTELSDRNAKIGIKPVDIQSVLNKVGNLPISSWAYKNNPGVKHIGPMAQDFKATFEVGENETSISTIDRDGVALAAIQALNQLLIEKENKIAELEARLAKIETAIGY